MGYAKISNLYRRPDFIDAFKKVWVLEKVHGSSAHLAFSPEGLHYFAGGGNHDLFVKFFNKEQLLKSYENFQPKKLTLYGEVYGGKVAGMSHTYGKEQRFIVFDVKIDDKWLDVPDAVKVTERFNQEFVWHQLVENTIENLNKYRDQPSPLAKLRGIVEDKEEEGIVAKPLYEMYDKNGGRWIIKHKREGFCERLSKKDSFAEPGKLEILREASEIAEEWITPMRMSHIIDKIQPKGPEDIPKLIAAMKEDLILEGENEIDWTESRAISSAIGKKTVTLYKEHLQRQLINA